MSAGASNVDAVSDNQNKEVGKAHGADNRYVRDENPCLFESLCREAADGQVTGK